MGKVSAMDVFYRGVIALIAVVQLVLGIVFVFFPHSFAALLGLVDAPGWTDWIFAQFGARAFGFAYGMYLVFREPQRQVGWIRAMIVVQIIDWIGTMLALAQNKVGLSQLSTAPFLPILFVIVLAAMLRREGGALKTRVGASR